MKRLLEIEFEDEEDYRQFLDGLTLVNREYSEVKKEEKSKIKKVKNGKKKKMC